MQALKHNSPYDGVTGITLRKPRPARRRSLPSSAPTVPLLRILNAVFWIICQFDKPNGSARSLGPSSIPSLGDGVMLGTAWIDRPVDTQGLRSLLPRPPQRSMEARPCSSQ